MPKNLYKAEKKAKELHFLMDVVNKRLEGMTGPDFPLMTIDRELWDTLSYQLRTASRLANQVASLVTEKV